MHTVKYKQNKVEISSLGPANIREPRFLVQNFLEKFVKLVPPDVTL